jgi:hypothetical protein
MIAGLIPLLNATSVGVTSRFAVGFVIVFG